MRRVAVIMAGGSGERFWPLSRRERPKQLLRLADPESTLLEQAVNRISPALPPERVFIATGRHLQAAIRKAGLVPDENVLAEPSKRNTAGCLVYVAACLSAKYGEDVLMGVLTADHAIGEPGKFREAVAAGMDAAEQEDAVVTIGIRPTRPETGYGYIETAEGAAPIDIGRDGPAILPVESFREKPEQDLAQQYADSGRFFWNGGMFFWKISTFLREFDQAKPEFAQAARGMAEAIKADDSAKVDEIFNGLEDISIDYALMEKARRVLVVRADFPWDDVGAWDALDRSMPHDDSGNVRVGDPVMVDSSNCIVYNSEGADAMRVAVIGCENLVVVTCGDAVLVADKSRVQDVKKAVQELKDKGAKQV